MASQLQRRSSNQPQKKLLDIPSQIRQPFKQKITYSSFWEILYRVFLLDSVFQWGWKTVELRLLQRKNVQFLHTAQATTRWFISSSQPYFSSSSSTMLLNEPRPPLGEAHGGYTFCTQLRWLPVRISHPPDVLLIKLDMWIIVFDLAQVLFGLKLANFPCAYILFWCAHEELGLAPRWCHRRYYNWVFARPSWVLKYFGLPDLVDRHALRLTVKTW